VGVEECILQIIIRYSIYEEEECLADLIAGDRYVDYITPRHFVTIYSRSAIMHITPTQGDATLDDAQQAAPPHAIGVRLSSMESADTTTESISSEPN
jgi:hypothetical protein